MTKIIEDCRIGGSPIEESTRYVLYDEKKSGRWRYVQPQNIMQSNLSDQYVSTMDFLFETYAGLVEPMKALFQKRLPGEKFEIEGERNGNIEKAGLPQLQDDGEKRAHRIAYGFTIRSAACDVIRCILPASTTANMGLVGNGRFYTQLISKLLSTNLDETQLLAGNIQKALNTQIPTFIKRAEKKSYTIETRRKMKDLCADLFKGVPIEKSAEVVLLPEDKAGDFQLHQLASMVFPYVQHSTEQIRQVIRSLPEEKRAEILATYIGKRQSKRDRPGRGLEYGYPIQFDIVAGFAEYRDLQRHRMLTQQRQDLGVQLGYSIPEEICEIGQEALVQECFQRTEDLHANLKRAGLEEEAQYATLFNHYIRWNMGMNLRELGHFTELRTQKAGHPKYRRTAQMMTNLYLKRYPDMEPMLRFVDHNDYDGGITRAEQEARTARKSLATGIFDDMD
jgi:thymidylate synthase ThyX